MKMRLIVAFAIYSVALWAVPQKPLGFQNLPLSTIRCDRQYAIDMNDVLADLAKRTPKKRLAEYRDYMLIVKQYVDLGYMLRLLEHLLTSDQRSLLRTPMQNYVNCRTTYGSTYGYGVQQFAPPKRLILPCEEQYAFETQQTLNSLARNLAPNVLSDYEDYLLKLKRYEDSQFRIADFEKRTATNIFDVNEIPSVTIAKLRSPSKRYDNCLDAIIRSQQLIG
jgi:hypothetical protein